MNRPQKSHSRASKDKLYRSFVSYVDHVKRVLRQDLAVSSPGSAARMRVVHIAPEIRLRSKTDSLESSSEFEKLLSDYVPLFNRFSSLDDDVDFGFAKAESRLPKFFRRSRLYLKISNAKDIDVDDYFERLWFHSGQRTVKVTKLWLCATNFPQNKIDCAQFTIQRFDPKHLDALVDSDVRRAFYPEAVINSKTFANHWFVKQQFDELREGTDQYSHWEIGETLAREFPDWPLQLLALADWNRGGLESLQREFFRIHLSLEVDDDVFAEPKPLPAIARAQNLPAELLDGPEFFVGVDQAQVIELKQLVESASGVLKEIALEKYNWEFIKVAFGYLGKAFLCQDDMDQLLWYVVVLETLFGEEEKGINKSIRDRLSKILGSTEKEKKLIRDVFNDLYRFRSTHVHGKKYESKAVESQLAAARYFARQALKWFLVYLARVCGNLRRKKIPAEKFPSREELLQVIDFDEKELERIRLLIENLPEKFPRIKDKET